MDYQFEQDINNNGISALFIKLKFFLFRNFSYILTEEIINIFVRLVIAVIELFQLLSFSFREQLQPLWKSNLALQLQQLFQVTNLYTLATVSNNYNAILILFYAGICFLSIMIMNMIYQDNQNQKESNENSRKQIKVVGMGTMVFKIFCELYIDILYQPFLYCSFVLTNCYTINGVDPAQLYYFPGTICGSGNSIIHIVVAYLAIIMLTLIALIIGYLYFEPRYNSNKIWEKTNGNPECIMVIMKFLLVFSFNFLNLNYDVFLLAVLSVSGFIQILYINNYPHLHNQYGYKIRLTQLAIINWTSMFLVFARVTLDTIFDNVISIWILGVIILSIVVWIKQPWRIHLLLQDPSEAQDTSTFIVQIDQLIRFLPYINKDTQVDILFSGFKEKHKIKCQDKNCPARIVPQLTKLQEIQLKAVFGQDIFNSTNSKDLIQCLYLIDIFFEEMILKKPKDFSLAAYRSIFLLDYFGQPQKALQELERHENNSDIPVDIQFIIYRISELARQQMMNQQAEQLGDMLYAGIIKRVKNNIELSANLHLDLWTLLREDFPDTNKLFELGKEICFLEYKIEASLRQLTIMRVDISKLLVTYAKFVLNVQNDKEGMEKIMQKVGQMQIDAQLNMREPVFGQVEQHSSQMIIVISGSFESLGIINNINLSASKYFGNRVNDVINKKIQCIQPRLYQLFHDGILTEAVVNREKKDTKTVKERFIPGKHKDGFLAPIYLLIRHMGLFSEEGKDLKFFAELRVDKQYKTIIYLLTNLDGNVDDASANWTKILRASLKHLEHKSVHISAIIPSYLESINQFKQISGAKANINVLTSIQNDDNDDNNNDNPKSFQFQQQQQDLQLQYEAKINLWDLRLDKMNPDFIAGQFFKIEIIKDQDLAKQQIKQYDQQVRENRKVSQKGTYIFKYDVEDNQFVGSLESINTIIDNNGQLNTQNEEFLNNVALKKLDLQSSINILQSKMQQSNSFLLSRYINYLEDKRKQQLLEIEMQNQKKDFGAGIRIMRWFNYRLFEPRNLETLDVEEIEENKNEKQILQEQGETQEEKVKEINNENEGLINNNNHFQSGRKAFVNQLKEADLKNKNVFRNLQIASISFLILFLLIGVLNYIQGNDILYNMITGVKLIQQSSQILSDSQSILFNLLTGLLINKNIIYNNYDESLLNSLANDLTSIQQQMQFFINRIDLAEKLIQQNQLISQSQEHSDLFNLRKINIRIYENKQVGNMNYNLNEVNQLLISKTLEQSYRDIGTYNMADSIFYFLYQNLQNNIFTSQLFSINLYIQDLLTLNSKVQSIITSYFSVTWVIIIIFIILVIPAYTHVSNAQKQMLMMFIEIPYLDSKNYFRHCENFINQIKLGEDDQNQIIQIKKQEQENKQQELDDEEKDMEEIMRRKKKRNFQQNKKKYYIFLVQFLIVTFCVQIFFIVDFSLTKSKTEQVANMQQEIWLSSVILPYYLYANNVFRSAFYDVNQDASNQQPTIIMSQLLNQLLQFNQQIEIEHNKNINYYDQSYVNYFFNMMNNDNCPLISTQTPVQCKNSIYGLIQQGMKTIMADIVQQMQQQIYEYNQNYLMLNSTSGYYPSPPTPGKTSFSTISYTCSYPNNTISGTITFTYTTNNLNNNTVVTNSTTGKPLCPAYLQLLLTSTEKTQQNQKILFYMRPIFESLVSQQLNQVQNILNNLINLRITLIILLIVFIIFSYILFWIPVFNQINKEMQQTKNMISIIPIEVIAKEKKIIQILMQNVDLNQRISKSED